MIKSVNSSDNKILKLVRSLGRRKGRKQEGLYFAEGARLTAEALSSIPEDISFVLMSESYAEQNYEYIKRLDSGGEIVYITRDKLFEDVCNTETPQGIAAVINIPEQKSLDLKKMNYILITDAVSDPGNMGTIIRTAEAAGVDAVCMTDGCVDVYSPKVVRSSMGSVFRTVFCKVEEGTVDKIKAAGFELTATSIYNSCPIEEASHAERRALIIGNEARGVSEGLLDKADIAVRIDMQGKVESLNAAVAAGIAMYMLRP